MSEQHAGDLSWLLKYGVAFSVRTILNSEEFGSLNAACQTASIQVGLTQACLEMKAKYLLLENEPPLHSYPHSQEEMLDRFSQMTSHEYQLLRMLREGSVGVEYLKKYLYEGEDEEVNVAGGGSIGIADFESVRADSADSARTNVDDCGDSKMFEDRAGGGGTVLGEADSTYLTGKSERAGGEDESMLGADGKETKKMDAEKDKLDDIADEDASMLEGVDGGLGGTGNTDEAGAKLDGADKSAKSIDFEAHRHVVLTIIALYAACRRAELWRFSSSMSKLLHRSAALASVNSTGIIASEPYTRLNGVSCVAVRIVVR
ncbi:hypothetical protein LXL04_035958 [Taraxacum kok-saghyz]